MRVLVAGGTGVIGRQLVPLLGACGHEVVVLSRRPPHQGAVSGTVRHEKADLLDIRQVRSAFRSARPDAVIHTATAIPAEINPRKLAKDFAVTNRLRTEGTRNLLATAAKIGTDRIITQGLAYAYDPAGGDPATEDDALWVSPPAQFAPVLAALRDHEQQTTEAGGLVLRLGHLYGPGSAYASDGSFASQVRARKVPLVGGGTAMFSFVHAHDAATAIVAALDKPVTGVLNVVDNDPAPMSTWLPEYASMLAARPPKSAPAMLARLAVGSWGVAFMTQLRGADNARARLQLDWKPRFGSWRTGLADDLNAPSSASAEVGR